MLIAGTAKAVITPRSSVWMDGMIRAHKSEGVHDDIFARALVLSPGKDMTKGCAIVSVEVCGLKRQDVQRMKQLAEEKTSIPGNSIIIAATHTHSGPATFGYFNPVESEYVNWLIEKVAALIEDASHWAREVGAGYASGSENTISHYRRLLATDGHVVMNWEPYPADKIVGPLGKVDPEVGVLKLVDAKNPQKIVCLLFNHAGHPNVMSGDNYLISGDYSGLAMRLLETQFGGVAMFVNGAQGTMDIDGLKDRDWEGVERTGNALAKSVSETAQRIEAAQDMRLRTGFVKYNIPPRKITREELSWAENILKSTGGKIQAMADGVGDDYKALLYKRIHENEHREILIEQTCIALNNCGFISFPGELFTEIGMHIKEKSPFEFTYIIGLANGGIGYLPTKKAIGEGGYEVLTRETGDEAEEIVVSQSLGLLGDVFRI